MSRMRVHELAKVIAKDNKEIISILKEQGIEKKAQSALDDNEIELVKKAFGISLEESGSNSKEQPEEKKNISQVYNPQNSQASKNEKKNGKNEKPEKNNNGADVKNNSVTKEEKQNKESAKKQKQDFKGNKNDKRDKNKEQNSQGKQVKQENKNNTQPKQQPKPPVKEKEETIKTITIPETITIKELADKMKVQPAAIVKKLFMQGTMVTVNQEIEFDMAEEIALEYNVICEPEEKVDVIAELLKEAEEPEESLVPRPPVVCVMGHVDHGKTSLLDAIRDTHVIDREAGGITQHIGAYVVECNGQRITFLDTPGHEAFTAMRMRGANATDIAILVVAADDGVMPQTIEAINHAKAAGTEIIVAINKIDKPSANIERVKQELSEHELIAEDWGGSTVFAPVSAKTGEGIPELLDMILLTADILEFEIRQTITKAVIINLHLFQVLVSSYY